MKCPHCLVAFHEDTDTWESVEIGEDPDGDWTVATTQCPSCQRYVVRLETRTKSKSPMAPPKLTVEYVRPRASGRPPVPAEVPAHIAADYKEACLVFADSPKASAALSRRVLQIVLREAAGVKHGDLIAEIDQVLAQKTLLGGLAAAIDAVRAVGNFAAHPMKSQRTGEIVDVEPGEAEWLLDVLESLFDLYFVAPAALQKKRDALDAKLKEVGRPPLKS